MHHIVETIIEGVDILDFTTNEELVYFNNINGL